MHLNLIDVLKMIAAWCLVAVVTLGWVHLTRQPKVSRTRRQSLAIVGRLLLVFLAYFGVFGYCLGISAKPLLIFSGFILVIVPLASLKHDPPGALWILIMLPIYTLKQYILGFPDHDEVILTPPEHPIVHSKLSDMIDRLGVVRSTLKPSGKVEIDGTVYSATTADGKMLDEGAAICVSDIRNTILIVTSFGGQADAVQPFQ